MLKTETPRTIHLADYQAHPFSIETVHLTFHLHSTATKVESRLTVKRNPGSTRKENNLILDGEELTFVMAKINGELLKEGEYQVSSDGLVLNNVPDEFTLEIENIINPESNKALDGLYKSGDIFCTQNEPEGFRRITYYLDRPDVMARFTTKIIAPLEDFPILLSNGNPIGEGQLDGGLHWAEWEDPFPKPSYLYALVAGNLGLVRDSYTTHSGRKIDLRIYCDKGNESRCDHAMESLKKSMKWDEETFGLEYDLDIYMIVAVDSFNMGAMENKGLNIFNSVYVLANAESATDDNFLGIESVVGHEYFHNWTGNRITCRDWFQLTLKEGLTVYRDQEFSSDLNSRTVQRISPH
jgi:aminopeptidase N